MEGIRTDKGVSRVGDGKSGERSKEEVRICALGQIKGGFSMSDSEQW